MQFEISYTTKEKLKSLSERLKYIARNKNSGSSYINHKVKSENLQFNISLIITHIILKLKFIDRNKEVFQDVINKYNEANSTTLTFEDFESIFWIRLVKGEVILPEVVRSYISQVGRYEKEGKPFEIVEGRNDLIRCLQIYYREYFEDLKPTITKEQLETILNKFGRGEVTIEFLIEKKIIEFDSDNNFYLWSDHIYNKDLGGEIAATLWLLINESSKELNFLTFFKLINRTNITVNNLSNYLDERETSKICELAVSYLEKENDLNKSDAEFNKIWLDSPNYTHTNINDEIPIVEFNYKDSFNFIENVNHHKSWFHGLFDYQRTRSFCYTLLRLIISNDPKYPSSYQNTIKILKDISKPILVWTLYNEIPSQNPEVIPYLLNDTDLIPIAFKQIDKIEIADDLLSEQSNQDVKLEESYKIKNQFWLEMFDLILEEFVSIHDTDKEGEFFAKILIDVANKTFKSIGAKNTFIGHDFYRKRYKESLKRLNNKRITSDNIYPRPLIYPRLIFHVMPEIYKYLENQESEQFLNQTASLKLNSGYIDLCIEILKLSNINISETEISQEQVKKIGEVRKGLVSLLKRTLTQFYSIEEIDVNTYSSVGIERRTARRTSNEFGFEIIDWGYLYLHLQRENEIGNLNIEFEQKLNFKTDGDKYDDQNKEQFEKVKLYLRSLMLAFISINKNKDLYEIEGLPVSSTLDELERLIKEYSLKYCTDKLPESKIDVFNEEFNYFGKDLYYKSLISLLNSCINFFRDINKTNFVEVFFAKSIDIGRMLTAINILDSKELKDIISKRINEINVEEFVASIFSTTELQNALIEAVNSDSHWNLAKPLVEKIQKYYDKMPIKDTDSNNLLFEINLLIAYKDKDFEKLNSFSVPKEESSSIKKDQKGDQIKKFFIALFKTREENYDEAIPILKSLLSKTPKNSRYAFLLYFAETKKACLENNSVLLMQTNKDWDEFVENLNSEEKIGLSEKTDQIASNKLFYYVAMDDKISFDQTLNKLPNGYIYDEDIISTIYNYYLKRDLHELAFEYISSAETYLKEHLTNIPNSIQSIINNSVSTQLLSKYKISLERIRNLPPSSIPKITPDVINDKPQLNYFILNELIQVLKIIKEKKEALRQVTHENRFTDFIQAILRLRFPIWGWSIQDQPRLGTSTRGADAGNADLVVQSGGGINIALIEAFILRNKEYTQKHILKCPNYLDTINKYYIVVYYLGDLADFENKWLTYKSDVMSISYPTYFAIDLKAGFIDIANDFEDVNNFKIAKTIHDTNIEMFHIMINLR